jgi:superfamily II DNA or RNA helicase
MGHGCTSSQVNGQEGTPDMCKPIEEGGQRCAAHTRGAFQAVMTQVESANKFTREKVRTGRIENQTNLQAVIDYASTPTGRKEVAALVEDYKAALDPRTAAWLTTAVKAGDAKAAANKETGKTIRQGKAKETRAASLSSSTLRATRGVTSETSLLAIYPDIAAQWDAEKNGGLTPDQVTPYINARVWWVCDQGHQWEARCNNRTNRARNGAKPWCPECHGYRQKSLENMQENLAKFVTAVDHDPDAFESLSPAIRHAIMARTGMLSGSTEGFERATALSMIEGDLTLRDVVNAGDVNDIAGAVNEDLTDENGNADRIVDLSDGLDTPAAASGPTGKDMEDRVDRIMSSAGIAALVSDDERLVAQITRENIANLWNEAFNDPDRAEEILARVQAGAAKNPYRAMLAERFEADLRRVQDAPLPEGYVSTQVLANGTTMELTPSLMQKQFMLDVAEKRRWDNWSGTGAGKTLSGVLASRQINAQETVVVCPLDVVDRWRDEFSQRFPDTDIRFGFPEPGEDLAATHTGRPRVWIANVDKFSGNAKDTAALLAPLAERLDYAILDEAHLAKAKTDASASIRRRNLVKFMDTAGAANDDLAVTGSTATPVITDLHEAKSMLRLTKGVDPKGFGTEATIKNCTAAYQAMSESGMRWRPAHNVSLDKPEIKVDITDRLPQVYQRLLTITGGKPHLMNNPAYMERALLPEKMDTVVERLRKHGGPAVVYTDLVTDMVDPIADRLRTEGYRTARYTGEETPARRKEILRQFQNGEIDVIVGSRPIGTGVDGLQYVSNKMIKVCAPWTGAQDEQIDGRVMRQGQTENVEIDYIVTEATLQAGENGEKMTWSHDRRRINRIKYRRALSDAAVDGVIPQGQLDSEAASTGRSVEAMSKFVEMMRGKQDVAA